MYYGCIKYSPKNQAKGKTNNKIDHFGYREFIAEVKKCSKTINDSKEDSYGKGQRHYFSCFIYIVKVIKIKYNCKNPKFSCCEKNIKYIQLEKMIQVQQRLYGFVKKEKRCYDQDQINSTKKKFFMPMPENGPFYS